MRSYLAGFILVLTLATGAMAQATGFVTALGFGGNYRPDCWTPLLVHLDSSVSNADSYQIQVRQQDLDKDTVIYSRTVALGPQAHQDYWVYFIPQPTRQPDGEVSLPQSRERLAEVLKVYLYDREGKTLIAQLPVGFTVGNVDPPLRPMEARRGRKFVLTVLDTAKPSVGEYGGSIGTGGDDAGAVGLMEDPDFVYAKTRELPENVLGYQAVDAILWLDADARDVSAGGASGFEAIQEWVRQGGHLVICQPPSQRAKIKPFADTDMLPVVAFDAKGEWAIEGRGKPGLSPLMEIAQTHTGPDGIGAVWRKASDQKPSWDFARATARPDAIVDAWIEWDPANPGADRTPYIARRAYGLGAVTWVAQDLGDPSLSAVLDRGPGGTGAATIARTPGWPHVWDEVFGWRNATRTGLEVSKLFNSDNQRAQYNSHATTTVDLGRSLLKGMEHTARGAWLITLAIFFFIGYWIIAGPGSYFYLAARRRKGLSWMVFAVAALLATGLTVVVVRLVLSGGAEAKHISVVRMVPSGTGPDGAPVFATTVNSRFGLYIPRDGIQAVSLPEAAAGQTSYLTPFAIHPDHMPEAEGFTDKAQYVVPTDDYRAGKPVTVELPYRRTLRKLQAQWAGDRAQGIVGSPRLLHPYQAPDPLLPKVMQTRGTIAGQLTNTTGVDLRHVYLAFRWEGAFDASAGGSNVRDFALYIASWPKDQTIDLESEYSQAAGILLNNNASPMTPNAPKRFKGDLSPQFWPRFWYYTMPSSGDDESDGFVRAAPLLAYFDRVGPSLGTANEDFKRRELHRRGARNMNLSQLVAAGRLAIVAVGRGPLPLRLDVNDDRVDGEGLTFYEVALPLDRSALTAPTTRPASGPASKPKDEG